ncbi:MAG TPA: hypothetical protein DEZ08_06210 [Dehalococcoidia bacterium]|nr:hypothetical protein [Dehalococcoidia bacterium]
MKDYIILHTAGQSSWHWSKVWALMTAPRQHPPKLYKKNLDVTLLDLPGHGSNSHNDTNQIMRNECIYELEQLVKNKKMDNYIIVAHGFSASLVLEALNSIENLPSKIVLISGIVAPSGKNLISLLPLKSKLLYQIVMIKSKLLRKSVKLSANSIKSYVCNGMDTMSTIQALGFYEGVPSQMLEEKTGDIEVPETVEIIYVKLTNDNLFPASLQEQVAHSLGASSIIEFNGCHQASLEKPNEMAELLLSLQ